MTWLFKSNLQQGCTAILVLVFGVIATGCGGDGMSTVEGAVSVDGTPIQQGAITFEPSDGVGPTAGATIANGTYTAEVPPGQKKVRITGFEITGQVPAYKGMKNSPMRDVVKDIVPEQFNSQSELTFTVESSDTKGDFELNSKSS